MMGDTVGMTHRLEDGILRIVFDRPGDRVNLLDEPTLHSLGNLLDVHKTRDDVRGLLFTSAKPAMFLAGMDVEAIAEVTDGFRAAEAARFGQSVFARINEFGRPSVAAIGGTCLGGGTELVLACDFRVAADMPETSIGLPEVQLGIIPGFGGSQRLPPLVGLRAACEMIVGGKRMNARSAQRIGLVDLVVPEAYLEREARALLGRAIDRGVGPLTRELRRKRSLPATAIERVGFVRRWAVGRARAAAAAKAAPDAYPAPSRAFDAIEAAFTLPLMQGLDLEARIVGELIPTQTSKNLIWLFQTQSALKGEESRPPAAPRKVERMAVLGAGIMGGGIAQLAADRGIPVRLRDLRTDAILTALQTAASIWKPRLDRGRLSRREFEQRMRCIAPTLDDSGLSHADVILEAVVEKLEIKQEVLAAVERRTGDRAIFASNTSSLPITDIAARALRPERVVGMHFFNPVHRMPLVEVIAGRHSSPEAVATVHALAVRLGKIPIVVRDGPGFLVNRILTFYVNEALRLLTEGVRIEAIDSAMVAFGMPIGPLALLDQVGLDTSRHVGEVLRQALGRRAAADSTAIDALVAEGRLGEKSGRGFYKFDRGRRGAPDSDIYRKIGAPTARVLPPETLQERMVLSMINEAAICLEEGIVRQPRDIDMAMVMGTGFPPFRGGLLRHADSAGIAVVVDRLARLADAQGERFRPAGLLTEMVREQRRFYP